MIIKQSPEKGSVEHEHEPSPNHNQAEESKVHKEGHHEKVENHENENGAQH